MSEMMTDDHTAALLRRFFGATSFEEVRVPRERQAPQGVPCRRPAHHDQRTDAGCPRPRHFSSSRQQVVDSGAPKRFQEVGIDRRTRSFGNVAPRFSSNEKMGRRAGEVFHIRGSISTQLVHTPANRPTSSTAWDDEHPELNVAIDVHGLFGTAR
jgi:hypothetical protein